SSGYNLTTGNPTNSTYLAGTGEIVHDGLIETSRGIVTLAGNNVTVGSAGVIAPNTRIRPNTMGPMHQRTSITMNGVVSIQPDVDPLTPKLPETTDAESNVQAYMPAYVEMTAQRSVTMGGLSLISAPAAEISLNATSLGGSGSARQLFNANP